MRYLAHVYGRLGYVIHVDLQILAKSSMSALEVFPRWSGHEGATATCHYPDKPQLNCH